ncbi:phosphosulfolactate synthase [Alicyclobacillus sp. SO9]|uniref:phosphosulfolactate synthase n=1 Tax=Alicyclobacillus sp. SO9 TaxID=2665646 RepID=UPI0018E847F1|nr:phosphosulfolactate synthase [Alicyclobacillus sp. SO9]
MEHPYWTELLQDVVPGRVEKPRISGLTMVIDSGLPISAMRGIFELAANHVDFWKLAYGSGKVLPSERIQDKISLCQEYDILLYPGGTAFEIAYANGAWEQYLDSVYDAGMRAVEISDGTISLPVRTRREMIHSAREAGFIVLTEVGKKIDDDQLSMSERLHLMRSDILSGADYVIVEGRESGLGCGIYDADGYVREQDAKFLVDGMGPLANHVIWEAPLYRQQVYHVQTLGSKANLGNISPDGVLRLESLRRGLCADTMALQPDIIRQQMEAAAEADQTDDASAINGSAGPTLWVDPRNTTKRKKKGKPR